MNVNGLKLDELERFGNWIEWIGLGLEFLKFILGSDALFIYFIGKDDKLIWKRFFFSLW